MCSDSQHEANKYGEEDADDEGLIFDCYRDLEDGFLGSWTAKWISLCGGLFALYMGMLVGIKLLSEGVGEGFGWTILRYGLFVGVVGLLGYLAGAVGYAVGTIFTCACESAKKKLTWRILFFIAFSFPSLVFFIIQGAK